MRSRLMRRGFNPGGSDPDFFCAVAGVLAMAWLIGILAVVLGIFLIFFGLKLRRLRSDLN